MRIISGDITTIECGIICQQVNCMGVMGSGLAKQIRDLFPNVYNEYKYLCDNTEVKMNLLGSIQVVKAVPNSKKLLVVNLFGQYSYGRNGIHTNKDAFRKALKKLRSRSIELDMKQVYIPYGIGCGLGGETWENISKIIEQELPSAIIVKRD